MIKRAFLVFTFCFSLFNSFAQEIFNTNVDSLIAFFNIKGFAYPIHFDTTKIIRIEKCVSIKGKQVNKKLKITKLVVDSILNGFIQLIKSDSINKGIKYTDFTICHCGDINKYYLMVKKEKFVFSRNPKFQYSKYWKNKNGYARILNYPHYYFKETIEHYSIEKL